MKIGLVLPEAPQYSETFFNSKIKGLIESGFDVIVFSSGRGKQKFFFKHSGAYPVLHGSTFRQFFLFVWVLTITFLRSPIKAKKLFSLDRKDGKSFYQSLKSVYLNAHILIQNLDWLHFGFATMAIGRENTARALGARMGVSFRGYDINIFPLKNPGCYDKLWKNADKIHTISDYLREKALVYGLSSATPFKIISPAIDVSLFRIKNEPGEISKKLRILTVGRLNWIKDFETSISAMKILKERGVDFVYNIIGTGIELERLKFAVYQSGLDDRICFSGKMEHSKIAEIMNESDIYLQTSLQEGFCVSVLEAQAAGLLCVVSDADGLKENVVDGITGWIVQKRKPKAFADKIIDILNMPVKDRREILLTAGKRVEDDFKMEDQKKKFKEFFSE